MGRAAFYRPIKDWSKLDIQERGREEGKRRRPERTFQAAMSPPSSMTAQTRYNTPRRASKIFIWLDSIPPHNKHQ
jgi:hypothetical protein